MSTSGADLETISRKPAILDESWEPRGFSGCHSTVSLTRSERRAEVSRSRYKIRSTKSDWSVPDGRAKQETVPVDNDGTKCRCVVGMFDADVSVEMMEHSWKHTDSD